MRRNRSTKVSWSTTTPLALVCNTMALALAASASRTAWDMALTITGSSSPLTLNTATYPAAVPVPVAGVAACAPTADAPRRGAPARPRRAPPGPTRRAGGAGTARLGWVVCGARASEGKSLDPAQFFAASRVVIVAGKGGVGKTTVSAALARAAARVGLSALIIEVEGKSGLATLFGQPPFDYSEVVLSPGGGRDGAADVSARTLTPDDALIEYLHDHGMSRISRRLASTGAVDMVATAAPGIKDILILGKVKQLEQRRRADLIVLDAPAAGHAISFLRSARGLLDAVKVGPINTQARDVLDLLDRPGPVPGDAGDPARGDAGQRADRDGLQPGGRGRGQPGAGGGQRPLPRSGRPGPVAGGGRGAGRGDAQGGRGRGPGRAAAFRRHRMDLQASQVARLAEVLPLPQLSLPYLFEADLGPTHVELLAQTLLDGIEGLDTLVAGAES